MLQYAGKTVNKFQLRWNNYKMNDRNLLKGQTCCSKIYLNILLVFDLFDHCSFLEDVAIIFIDTTDPTDANRREHYWTHTLKTMAPLGLNVKDDWVVHAIS